MKNRPADFPVDIEIPQGISYSCNNGWTVRRTIKGVKSKPMYFKEFGDALDYYNVLFEDKVEKKKKLKLAIARADRLISEREAREQERARLYAETAKDKLSIDNLHLLTAAEVKEKIEFYLQRLEILYDKETELWHKEMEAHGL